MREETDECLSTPSRAAFPPREPWTDLDNFKRHAAQPGWPSARPNSISISEHHQVPVLKFTNSWKMIYSDSRMLLNQVGRMAKTFRVIVLTDSLLHFCVFPTLIRTTFSPESRVRSKLKKQEALKPQKQQKKRERACFLNNRQKIFILSQWSVSLRHTCYLSWYFQWISFQNERSDVSHLGLENIRPYCWQARPTVGV